MKFECPICKKPLKKIHSTKCPKTIVYKNTPINFGVSWSGISWNGASNTPSVINSVTTNNVTYFFDYDSWTCSSHKEVFPGINGLVKNNHCQLDREDGKIIRLTICIFPFQFCLDYVNQTTTISKLQPFVPPAKGLFAREVTKINSILLLPWSHKAQVIDKARLYTLFS